MYEVIKVEKNSNPEELLLNNLADHNVDLDDDEDEHNNQNDEYKN